MQQNRNNLLQNINRNVCFSNKTIWILLFWFFSIWFVSHCLFNYQKYHHSIVFSAFMIISLCCLISLLLPHSDSRRKNQNQWHHYYRFISISSVSTPWLNKLSVDYNTIYFKMPIFMIQLLPLTSPFLFANVLKGIFQRINSSRST